MRNTNTLALVQLVVKTKIHFVPYKKKPQRIIFLFIWKSISLKNESNRKKSNLFITGERKNEHLNTPIHFLYFIYIYIYKKKKTCSSRANVFLLKFCWSFSLVKLIQNCSSELILKISKPKISRIPMLLNLAFFFNFGLGKCILFFFVKFFLCVEGP